MEKISARDLISETANSLGSAHYDPTVSAFLLRLMDEGSANQNTLVAFIHGVGLVTGILSEWVLAQLRDQKILT